ncbi:hypothetical protein FHS85_003487 [Rhodoligotrophos appendicifer]|uniref:hypothetical protein n=1 Tax=Rhodoligotrophos appendicifer TaxID=987056 RepID=UPI0014787BFA|nr:hypothetical protein [Rhodoligotrophos appendicifer]
MRWTFIDPLILAKFPKDQLGIEPGDASASALLADGNLTAFKAHLTVDIRK